MEVDNLPGGDRGNPQFIARIPNDLRSSRRESRWVQIAPYKNVSVEQELHFRSGAHSSSVEIGPTISPRISPVPAMEPIQLDRRAGGGGTTSAMGLPKRVIRIGLRVLWTRCKTDKHVALNLETAISSTSECTMVIDHGQTYFSRRGARFSPAIAT